MTKMKAFLLGFLLPAIALAGSSTDRLVSVPFNNSQFGLRNFVTNPDAEKNVSTGVTTSGATVSRNTSTPIEGKADFSVSLGNNATDSVTWAMGTLDNKLKNNNCELRASYTAASIGSNVVLQVLQGSNVVAQSPALATASNPTVISVNAPCGDLSTATTSVLRNSTGNSGTGAVKIDSLYYGLATNLSQVSQAQFYGQLTWQGTTNCSWSVNQAVSKNTRIGSAFSADTDCDDTVRTKYGHVTSDVSVGATDGQNPRFTLDSVPVGWIKVVVTGTFGCNSASGTDSSCLWQLDNGTTYVGNPVAQRAYNGSSQAIDQVPTLEFEWYNSSALSNQTYTIRGGPDPNASSQTAFIDAQLSGLQFNVFYYPDQSQIALRADTTPASWSGYHDTNCSWTVSSSSFSDYGDDASCTLTQVTNTNFGTVTSYGSYKPGLTITPRTVGDYEVCAYFSPQVNSGRVGSFALTTDAGVEVAEQDFVGNGSWLPMSLCGIFNLQSLSSASVRLRTKVDNATASNLGNVGGTGNRSVWWTIKPINTAMPAPLLVGSVTSSSTGAERVERVRFGGASTPSVCSSSPCTIYSQSGSWVLSVTQYSTGAYTINFNSGIFSAAPSCVVSSESIAFNTFALSHTPTTSSVKVVAIDAGGTARDDALNVICQGPR